MLDRLRAKGFQVHALHHAEAILEHDMTAALDNLESALLEISLPIRELVRGGGGEGPLTQRLRRSLTDVYGWNKHTFEIKKIVDGEEKESLTHEIDHVKKFPAGTFALEIEWNNKDPFFDRDLENFKRLHADGVISIGGIITRGETLQDSMRELIEQFAKLEGICDLVKVRKFYTPTPRQVRNIANSVRTHGAFETGWAHAFVADKFGEATTHWRKLAERVQRGVGNPCPLLLIGIPREVAML